MSALEPLEPIDKPTEDEVHAAWFTLHRAGELSLVEWIERLRSDPKLYAWYLRHLTAPASRAATTSNV